MTCLIAHSFSKRIFFFQNFCENVIKSFKNVNFDLNEFFFNDSDMIALDELIQIICHINFSNLDFIGSSFGFYSRFKGVLNDF